MIFMNQVLERVNGYLDEAQGLKKREAQIQLNVPTGTLPPPSRFRPFFKSKLDKPPSDAADASNGTNGAQNGAVSLEDSANSSQK